MATYTNFSSIIKNIDESDNAQNILSSNDVRLVDNIIELSSTVTGSSPTLDGGISINRGSLPAANMIFKEDVDQWVCGVSGEEKQIARLTTPANNSITFYDATSQSLKTNALITIDDAYNRLAIGKTNPTEKLTVYSSENTEDCVVNIETTQSTKSAILRIGNTFALTSTSNAGNAVLQFCNGKTGDLIRNNFFIGYDVNYMDNYLAMPLTIGSMGDSSFGSPSAPGTKTNIVRFFQNGVSVFGPLNANQISSHFNVKNPNSDTDIACFYNSSNVPVVIDKNSNLGLNVEFPTERLDVSGNGKFSGNLTISGTNTSANSVVNGSLTVNGTSTSTNSVVNGNITISGTSTSTRSITNGNVSIGNSNQLAQLSIVGQSANYDSSIIDESGLGLIGMYKELSFSAKNLPWYMGVGDGNSDTSRFVMLSSDTGLGNKPVVHVGFQRLEGRMYVRGSIHMTATDQAMKIPTVANSSLAGIGNTAGFMLYNTTTNTISINDGTAWRNLVCSNTQFLTNLYYPTPKSVSLPNSGVRRIDLGSGQSLNSLGSSNWVANGQYAGFKYVGATTTNVAKVIIDFYQSNEVTNQSVNFSIWKNGDWSGTTYTNNASELAQTITTFPSTVGYQHCSISFLINGLTQNDIFHLGFSLASGTADKLFYLGQLKITCDVSI